MTFIKDDKQQDQILKSSAYVRRRAKNTTRIIEVESLKSHITAQNSLKKIIRTVKPSKNAKLKSFTSNY